MLVSVSVVSPFFVPIALTHQSDACCPRWPIGILSGSVSYCQKTFVFLMLCSSAYTNPDGCTTSLSEWVNLAFGKSVHGDQDFLVRCSGCFCQIPPYISRYWSFLAHVLSCPPSIPLKNQTESWLCCLPIHSDHMSTTFFCFLLFFQRFSRVTPDYNLSCIVLFASALECTSHST
jgi:hypothetical protein